MKWYIAALKKYADFTGRASREEYWMYVLFQIIFIIVASIFDGLLAFAGFGSGFGIFSVLYILATFIPSLAVMVRRLHDIGKSGWMYFVSWIPLVGGIWLLVLLVTDSQTGSNEYGNNSKNGDDNRIVGIDDSLDSQFTTDNSMKSKTNTDVILLLVACWMFFAMIFWRVIHKLISNYPSSFLDSLYFIFNLIWGIVPILLALSIKDKSKRIVAFIMGGIYLAVSVFDAFKNLLRFDDFNFFSF